MKQLPYEKQIKQTPGLQTKTRNHWLDICPGEGNYEMKVHALFQYKHRGGEGKRADNTSKPESGIFSHDR